MWLYNYTPRPSLYKSNISPQSNWESVAGIENCSPFSQTELEQLSKNQMIRIQMCEADLQLELQPTFLPNYWPWRGNSYATNTCLVGTLTKYGRVQGGENLCKAQDTDSDSTFWFGRKKQWITYCCSIMVNTTDWAITKQLGSTWPSSPQILAGKKKKIIIQLQYKLIMAKTH